MKKNKYVLFVLLGFIAVLLTLLQPTMGARGESNHYIINDDFEDAALDTTVWSFFYNAPEAYYTIDNGQITLYSGLIHGGGSSIITNELFTPADYPLLSLEVRARWDYVSFVQFKQWNSGLASIGTNRLDDNLYASLLEDEPGVLERFLITGIDETVWHTYRIDFINGTVYFYVDGDLKASQSENVPYYINMFIRMGPMSTGEHKIMEIDYVRLVTDNLPVANAGGPYFVDEGGTVTLIATGYDPDDDLLTYAWDLDNDGSFETIGQGVNYSAGGLDGPDTQAVAVQVCDDYNGCDVDTVELNIENVAPIVGPITAPVDPVQLDTVVNTSADFTDQGIPDTHLATWDWGDGTSSDGDVSESNGSGVVSGNHVYSTPGVYTVSVTVTDDDGGSATSIFQYVVIYDPEGGFVTGGGWFDSPEGAYYPDPTLTGKATFGFVSKYKKGSTTPTGNTEFQFKVADLNFHSTEYQWLVVAGPKAMFKGFGTVNGQGNYGFLISAIDEKLTPSTEVDLFRIKIWDIANHDMVIYDNLLGVVEDADPTTVLGGGSIVIHKP